MLREAVESRFKGFDFGVVDRRYVDLRIEHGDSSI